MACDGQLGAMDGLAMDGLEMDGSAIKRWMARQCRDGQLAMDNLAMERWTAH